MRLMPDWPLGATAGRPMECFMLKRLSTMSLRCLIWIVLTVVLSSCFGVRGFTEITASPYPLISEDDSIARFGDADGNTFVEVRKEATSRPVEYLAVHYRSLFPGGEIIRPGDNEEYVKINGKTAYRVVFRTKYIRKRKRLGSNPESDPKSIPEGWTPTKMEDPVTGEIVRVLHGPIIPQQRILYLVQGDPYIYYIFLRADGDSIKVRQEEIREVRARGYQVPVNDPPALHRGPPFLRIEDKSTFRGNNCEIHRNCLSATERGAKPDNSGNRGMQPQPVHLLRELS